MPKDNKLWIDMCAGSELKDTQGETLSVEGADIEDLQDGKGRLNDNHGKGFFNSLGRVTEAKKIFKSDDCENDRHKYYWEKIKAPFIYAKGYLFNDEDHPNAKAAAAIIRNIHREDASLVMKASVEGGVVARGVSDPSRLARTKIHSVALTFTPANNATLVEPLSLDKSEIDWESDKQLIKSVMHLAQTNVPSFRHIERHASANTIYENINKIQELAKSLGIDIEVKNSDPQAIMKNAVYHKLKNNIEKINKSVKLLKVNHLNLVGPKKIELSASKQIQHPEHISKLEGFLHEDHPMRPTVVDYIHNLTNEARKNNDTYMHLEAQRLYNKHIKSPPANVEKKNKEEDGLNKGVASAAKKTAVALALAHAAHFYTGGAEDVKSSQNRQVASHNERVGHPDMKLDAKQYGYDDVKSTSIKSPFISRKKIKNRLKKALLAGYGGAGAPTNLVSGGVVQSESIDVKRKKKVKNKSQILNKSFSYIVCDNCGEEQVFMPHQVKCRECKNNFSLYKLNSLKS
jgi:hypothetical protein